MVQEVVPELGEGVRFARRCCMQADEHSRLTRARAPAGSARAASRSVASRSHAGMRAKMRRGCIKGWVARRERARCERTAKANKSELQAEDDAKSTSEWIQTDIAKRLERNPSHARIASVTLPPHHSTQCRPRASAALELWAQAWGARQVAVGAAPHSAQRGRGAADPRVPAVHQGTHSFNDNTNVITNNSYSVRQNPCELIYRDVPHARSARSARTAYFVRPARNTDIRLPARRAAPTVHCAAADCTGPVRSSHMVR
jgi:hypothetical protein